MEQEGRLRGEQKGKKEQAFLTPNSASSNFIYTGRSKEKLLERTIH